MAAHQPPGGPSFGATRWIRAIRTARMMRQWALDTADAWEERGTD